MLDLSAKIIKNTPIYRAGTFLGKDLTHIC